MAGVWRSGRQYLIPFDEADGKNRLVLTTAPALKCKGIHGTRALPCVYLARAFRKLLNSKPWTFPRHVRGEHVKCHVTMGRKLHPVCATFIPTSPQVSPLQPASILVISYD